MAPQGEMREKERHESSISDDDDEELQHYDSIDLESCDFQPFLTTQSGIALNYHTSDHPEHKILMQESFVESNHDDGTQSRCCSQAMHSFGVMIRPTSLGVSEKEERFPSRRRVAFMGAIAFTGFLAIWHVMNATRFLNFGAFTLPTLAIHKSQSTTRKESDGTPRQLQNAYRNVNDLPIKASDVQVYFEIPGGAATSNVTDAWNKCFGLQLQSSPKNNAADQTESLESSNPSMLVTTDIWQTASRLNATLHRGRLFVMFHNPMERLLHNYNHHASSHQQQESMTFQQYLSTVPDNIMVRTLVNVKEGPLTDAHLEMAKLLVGTKFLVGLADKPALSLGRFQAYFDWKHESPKDCTKNLLTTSTTDDIDSPEYIDAKRVNRLDAELYNHVGQIFQRQARISSR